jgi:Ca-activated chloride channel family protein
MRKGILDALAQPAADGYLRIAFLLTDGYVGDEFRIFQAIEKERRGARVFSLGVGSSINRYLLDRAAEIGRGEAFYVRQDENSDKVIKQFFKRVASPALAHIEIDWGNLDVTKLSPAKVPDLWAGQPIRIHGRYSNGGEDTIVVRGQLANQPYEQRLRVKLPQNAPAHEAMASVWARQQVRELMSQMVRAGQTKELIEKVTQLGLTFRLMTQWTSFVAVEEKVVNVDGKPQTVVQPVEMPEDVSYEGVFGEQQMSAQIALHGLGVKSFSAAPQPKRRYASPPPVGNAPPEQAGAAPPTLKGEESNDISFAPGDASLSTQVKRLLNKLAAQICLDISHIKTIVITGHADSSPQDNFKRKLSLERAVAVADYLMSQCPALTYDKLVIKGKADRKPVADNNTEIGRALNRRVEIQIKR